MIWTSFLNEVVVHCGGASQVATSRRNSREAGDSRRVLRCRLGNNVSPTTRTVETHVANLGNKLERNSAEPLHLLTVPRVDYRLVVDGANEISKER